MNYKNILPPMAGKNDEVVTTCNNQNSSTNSDGEKNSTIYNMRKRKKPNSPPVTAPAGFSYPKKTSKSFKLTSQDNEFTNTQNPYSCLDDSDMEASDIEETITHNSKYPSNTAKNEKPPPIIMKGIPDNHKNLVQELKSAIGEKFYIKYTKYNTNIYPQTLEAHKTLKAQLINNKREFYTYTLKCEKTHAFVMRGLQTQQLEETIKQELREIYNINATQVFQLKTKQNPTYMIVTPANIKLKDLSKVQFINHTRIYWERKTNNKKIIQCKNCQQWGHATMNCHSLPNCLKCGEEHATRDCSKDPNTPPKCANCAGAHLSNSTECPLYQYKISKIQESVQQKFPKGSNKSYVNNNYNIDFPDTLMLQKTKTTMPSSNNNNNAQNNYWRRDNSSTKVQSTSTNKLDDFEALSKEFQKTNQLINVKGLLQAITDFNKILEKCTTAVSKFQATLQFFADIDNYGL